MEHQDTIPGHLTSPTYWVACILGMNKGQVNKGKGISTVTLLIRKHFELNNEFSKVYKNIHVNKARRGQGIYTLALLVIQKSLLGNKAHLEQPIWPELWRVKELGGGCWLGHCGQGIEAQLAFRSQWLGRDGRQISLCVLLTLNQSAHLTRLAHCLGGVIRHLKSQWGGKALQLRLPGSKAQALLQGHLL